MATTSPDSIQTPDPSSPYNLVSDLATMANSVQTALNRRANFYVGTSAQRIAFTDAPEGVHWQDTNGDKWEWVRKSGAWRGANPLAGEVLTSGTANTTRIHQVNFPSGYFSGPPSISVAAKTTACHNIVGLSFSAESETGVTIHFRYATNTDIYVSWVATPA